MPARYQALMTASQLGQVLQASRRSGKLSQAELAARVGVSQSRVSHLEHHPEALSVEQLMAWCAALGLELALGPKGTDAVAEPRADW